MLHSIAIALLALPSSAVAGPQDSAPLGVELEDAFPALRFERPVFLTGAGDGSDRIFIVEQAGKIWVTEEGSGERALYLDIEDRVSREGNEEGLLGLAFHPRFASNGRLFVHYSSSVLDKHGILASFQVDEKGSVDPDSEETLLEVPQPYRNHNGGMIGFGPDGFLYMALGDGGAANDPFGHGQNLSTLLGTILRIDVDSRGEGLAYGIPGDNPFVDVEGARPEIWAFGLRNAWRFSFDRETGELWAGDVGQNKEEEISIIVRGGNYGWKAFEAGRRFSDDDLSRGEHVPPVMTYGRKEGISVTGGAVYRGARYPQFVGRYFCADYFTGNVWTVTPNEAGDYSKELVRRSRRPIASFGEDDRGELFALAFDGVVYRVVPSDLPEGTFDDWPRDLADAGIYADLKSKELAEGVVKYEVNAPFWADGAGKRRYVKLPGGTAMGYSAEGALDFPVGATIVKEFTAPGRRGPQLLETRLSRRTESGWEAATYVWSRSGRKAKLSLNGKALKVKSDEVGMDGAWHAPSASQCTSCHFEDQGFALGLTAAQLNRDVDGANQLELLASLGLLDLPAGFDAAAAPTLVDPHGEGGSLEDRARAWLDVNCAMCHQPGAPGNAAIDLRWTTSLVDSGLVNGEPTQGDLGLENARIVAPGAPERSTLLGRITALDDTRMPSVASHRVDERGAALIEEWIRSLDQD